MRMKSGTGTLILIGVGAVLAYSHFGGMGLILLGVLALMFLK